MTYEKTPIRQSKKADLLVFSEMSTRRIIWRLIERHHTGLLIMGNLLFGSIVLHIPHYAAFWYSTFFN